MYNRNYDGQNRNRKRTVKERREEILKILSENGEMTSVMLKELLEVSKPTIERDLAKLREENKLEYVGSSKRGVWIVK